MMCQQIRPGEVHGHRSCLQVQVLVELRAIFLEEKGRMSRYGPLILVELIK